MILLLPHFTLLFVLFTTYERKYPVNEESAPEAPVPTLVSQPTEGTVDWYANLQAIQSLMGLMLVHDISFSDLPITCVFR